MRPTRFALSLLPLVVAACGPKYALGVPNDLIGSLSYEARIELLEAENELAVSLDKLDESRNEVLRTRDSLRRAKDRESAAHQEEGQAKDDGAREVARLAVSEGEARVDYLRARQEVNLKNERAEELAVRCAHARFEQSRLAVLRKNKVKGSERLNTEEFDRQVKACDAELAGLRNETKDEAKRAQVSRTAWETQKAALAKKTFDARASPYVE